MTCNKVKDKITAYNAGGKTALKGLKDQVIFFKSRGIATIEATEAATSAKKFRNPG